MLDVDGNAMGGFRFYCPLGATGIRSRLMAKVDACILDGMRPRDIILKFRVSIRIVRSAKARLIASGKLIRGTPDRRHP